jgi:hypothetical protein
MGAWNLKTFIRIDIVVSLRLRFRGTTGPRAVAPRQAGIQSVNPAVASTHGRPRIEPETEATIRAALTRGGIGMRKIAVQFGVATGTVQRIARRRGASIAA